MILITFPLAYFTVKIQYIIHITYKTCVNQMFMSSVRPLVNSRLLVVQFLWSQVICKCVTLQGVSP